VANGFGHQLIDTPFNSKKPPVPFLTPPAFRSKNTTDFGLNQGAALLMVSLPMHQE
jgi:hypothetical protein